MIIAQITDLHIGFDGPDAPCKNTARLKRVLKTLKAQSPAPDMLVITGDLVEHGAHWAYENLRKILKRVDIPYYLAMGNHDDRAAFSESFPETTLNAGFVQYAIEGFPLRVIVLDTLKPGFHGGGFCEARAAWLSQTLAQQPDKPTLIALHHPPIETGIGWMTPSRDDPWIERLRGVVGQYDNIVQIISGHIHRTIVKPFSDTVVTVSHAVAPQVKLDLSPISPTDPDGRVLLVDGPGGYCLHHWDGHSVTTHFAITPDGRPIVHYDEKHAFIVPHTLDLKHK